jgi:hypothetical protein
MLYPLPTNALPFLILGIVATTLGLRGLFFYKKSKLPLSLYYSLAIFLIGLSTLWYSVPFVFTRSSEALKVAINIGDMFYYASILVAVRIVWYLGFNKKISFLWLLVPYLLIIIACEIAIINSWGSIQYQFYADSAYFPVDPLASKLFAAMSSAYIFVGYLTIRQAHAIKDLRQKIRLNSIGLGFLAGGIVAIYNYLFLQGNSSGSVVMIGYIAIAAILFTGIFIVSRKKISSKS